MLLPHTMLARFSPFHVVLHEDRGDLRPAELHRQLLARSPELAELGKQPFPKLIDARVERLAADDPFRVLAKLPASIYVTTSGDPLLLKTIKAADRISTPKAKKEAPARESLEEGGCT